MFLYTTRTILLYCRTCNNLLILLYISNHNIIRVYLCRCICDGEKLSVEHNNICVLLYYTTCYSTIISYTYYILLFLFPFILHTHSHSFFSVSFPQYCFHFNGSVRYAPAWWCLQYYYTSPTYGLTG